VYSVLSSWKRTASARVPLLLGPLSMTAWYTCDPSHSTSCPARLAGSRKIRAEAVARVAIGARWVRRLHRLMQRQGRLAQQATGSDVLWPLHAVTKKGSNLQSAARAYHVSHLCYLQVLLLGHQLQSAQEVRELDLALPARLDLRVAPRCSPSSAQHPRPSLPCDLTCRHPAAGSAARSAARSAVLASTLHSCMCSMLCAALV
jgi:hypothetical protein